MKFPGETPSPDFLGMSFIPKREPLYHTPCESNSTEQLDVPQTQSLLLLSASHRLLPRAERPLGSGTVSHPSL